MLFVLKGGENMEFGNLGAINTIVSKVATLNNSGKSSTGFGALFANLMGNESTTAQGVSSEQLKSTDLFGDELEGLLNFLQKNDILELENGKELLEQVAFQSNTDIISIIGTELNLSKKELLDLLSKLYEQLSTISGNTNEVPLNTTDENLLTEINLDEMIAKMIEMILSLQVENLTVKPDKNFSQAMQALKLFELLSANKDSMGNQNKLQEFMRMMNEKIEMVLNQSSSANRQEFLQKTFNTLVEELSGKGNVQTEQVGENIGKVLGKTDSSHQGFMQFQQMSRPEQLTLMANQSNKTVSAEELIKQFESILSRSHLTKMGGTQRLFIKLNPEHLGALRIELIHKDSAIIARILTSTSVAKEMMESHLNGLKQAFTSQNIQVERVEISQQFTQQERFLNREQQQGQGRQEQQGEEAHEQQTSDFTESFEEALLNIEA